MKCVSYTRTLPWKNHQSKLTIAEQNQRIAAYLAEHKELDLQKKYSDRKNDEKARAAFDQMTNDGVERKFDCIIVASMYYCGPDFPAVRQAIKETLYATGIDLIVLEEGFFLCAVARTKRGRQMGTAVFSFGLLFAGMEQIQSVVEPLALRPEFEAWMAQVREKPLWGLLLGLGMTLVVQSSSATIGVLQGVARQAGPDGVHSLLGLAGAVPVLLGDNVGTTITAILAAAGGTRDAKRAAAAHCCFNLSGSLVCLLALPWFVRLVELLPPEGEELEIIARQIANAHTLFNALCTLIWLPLTPLMVRLVTTLVPEKRTE